MKTLLTALTLTAGMALATAAFAGPGDMRSYPYGPVPMFTSQTGESPHGAPYALTGDTTTTSDALRNGTMQIGGNRDTRDFAAFRNAR